MTDPAALEAFATATETAPAWSLSMSQQLGALIGRTVASTDAFDSVFRLRPPGWRFGLGEDPVDPRIASVNIYQWDGWEPRGCVVVSNARTLLLGLVAATARAYAAVGRQSGYVASLGLPLAIGHTAMIRTRKPGTPPGLPEETAEYRDVVPGEVLRLFNLSDNGAYWELLPLSGADDPVFTDDGNLCPVVPA